MEPRWVVPSVVTDQPTKVGTYQAPPLHHHHTADGGQRLSDTRVHTYYPEESRSSRDDRYEPHHRRTRSMVPPSRGGGMGYDVESTSPLRRSTGMLRTESDYRMPPPTTRRSFHVSPTIQHRGRVRRYEEPPRGSSGILRRRGGVEGGMESASDTEAQDYWTMGSSRRSQYGAQQQQQHYGGRSNSLPRSLRSGYHRQAVRFTTTSLPYDSQEESDGAVSAPELPATRTMRRREYLRDFYI